MQINQEVRSFLAIILHIDMFFFYSRDHLGHWFVFLFYFIFHFENNTSFQQQGFSSFLKG